jgi:hypothetical protein
LPASFNQERLISYKSQLTELIQAKSETQKELSEKKICASTNNLSSASGTIASQSKVYFVDNDILIFLSAFEYFVDVLEF